MDLHGDCLGARPEMGRDLEATRLDGDLTVFSANQTRLQHTLLGQLLLFPIAECSIVMGVSVCLYVNISQKPCI